MPRQNTGKPTGRPRGTINKFSAGLVEKAATSGLLPHEILLSFARGEPQIERSVNPETGEVKERTVYPDTGLRLQAANYAAPYYAPKLAQVQHKGSIGRTADSMSDDELLKLAVGETGDDKSESE
jgi:hypothetical protein